jgi:hypothetical protein
MAVDQIVISQRQCSLSHGYLGWNLDHIVDVINTGSEGCTVIVRDHGGPTDPHDTAGAFYRLCADVDAGFDVLHLDVCRLPHTEQLVALCHLVRTFSQYDRLELEVGGEREPNEWNAELVRCAYRAGSYPMTAVIEAGGHCWRDTNIGNFDVDSFAAKKAELLEAGAYAVKAHNMDWARKERQTPAFLAHVDAMNIAPEFAQVEIDAWLAVASPEDTIDLLAAGYDGHGWEHWYGPGEGTLAQRARTGLRYVLEQDDVRRILDRYSDHEEHVRSKIRAAIRACS